MRFPTFYILAFVAVIAAVGFHLSGWSEALDASHLKAESLRIALQQHLPVEDNPLAISYLTTAHHLRSTGFCLMWLSIICVVVAYSRRERGYYLLWSIFLTFDVMAAFLA
jgi:hypothetical protein